MSGNTKKKPQINTDVGEDNNNPLFGGTGNLTPKSPLSGNPLKYDAELIGLVDKLDMIQSYRGFKKWKSSFLRQFKSFLSEKGLQPAQNKYDEYSKQMENLEKKVNTVQSIMEKGNLTPDKTTVKGRNGLNEMCKTLTEMTEQTENLIPATKSDERRLQYNKYHLGVILVQDGFLEYNRMIRCQDKLSIMMNEQYRLYDIADRQQLDCIKMYNIQIDRFKDVMQDLGLYGIMQKCHFFADQTDDADEVIIFDPKTGSIIELTRTKCFSSGILTLATTTTTTTTENEGKDDHDDDDGTGNEAKEGQGDNNKNDNNNNIEKILEGETSKVGKDELIATLQNKFF